MRVDLKKMRPGGLTRCIMRAGPEKQLKPCRLLERKNKGQLAGTVCLYGSRQHSHISQSYALVLDGVWVAKKEGGFPESLPLGARSAQKEEKTLPSSLSDWREVPHSLLLRDEASRDPKNANPHVMLHSIACSITWGLAVEGGAIPP